MAVQLWSTFSSPLFTASNYAGKGGTATSGPSAPVAVGSGVNIATAIFSTSGTTVTASTSDVVVMMLIPEGAVIVGGTLAGKTGATSTTVKLGIGSAGTLSSTGVSTDGDLLAATNVGTTRTVTNLGTGAGGLPYKVPAITAATYPKWYPLIATIAGSLTVSLCFSVNIYYTTANQGVV